MDFRTRILDVPPLDAQFGVLPKRGVPEALQAVLFPGCHAILDGARVPDLPDLLARSGLPHMCLFGGKAARNHGEVAPWIVQLGLDDMLTRRLFTRSGQPADMWDLQPGIILRSRADLSALRRHFRKFTQLRQPATGKMMFFRFYAPETLRTMIAAMPPAQMGAFMGPVELMLAPTEDGQGCFVLERDLAYSAPASGEVARA